MYDKSHPQQFAATDRLQPPPEANALSRLEERIREVAGRLASANHKVETIANKLFGSMPEEAAKEGYSIDPYTIEDWLAHTQCEVAKLVRQLERFS